MRILYFVLAFLVIQLTTNAQQVRIANDSLYVNDFPTAAYELEIKTAQDFFINVFQFKKVDDGVKNVFQALVEQDLNSKGLLQTAKLSFRYQWNAGMRPAMVSEDNPIYVYAQIMGTQMFLSTKVTIVIDFGQSRGFFTDARLKDEKTGQVQSFNSMVDALNYMALDGWEFVQAYAITVGQQNVYHYLLRRKR